MMRSTGPTPETAALVLQRDGFACVRCGAPVRGERSIDWSLQHRRPRGMGGTRRADTNGPQSLVVLCGSGTTGCHGHVESHRTEALTNGWLVHQGDDPAGVLVLVDREARWVYLTASGERCELPPTAVGSVAEVAS